MAQVAFTPNIQRHVACPPKDVTGRTVRDVLEAVFAENEGARSYVLDDQGALRKHLVIFVDGRPIEDRETLGDPISEHAEVYVMQALSGG